MKFVKNILRKFGRDTFASLAVRNYRLYFIGQAVSLSGHWMQTIARSWLVLQLSGSGTAVGGAVAMEFLPILIFGPVGGVLVDRFSKQKLLIISQTAAGIIALALGMSVFFEIADIWMIYAFAFGHGLVRVVDNPTRQTFVLEMVGKERLTNAISLYSSEVNLARVIGPAIGGLLIATVGIAFCFILNGLSYGAALLTLFAMREKELYLTPLAGRTKGQVVAGLRYAASSPILRNTLLMLALMGMFAYEWNVSLPILARFTFDGDAGSYAVLMSSMGMGAVIGGLFAANRRRTSPRMLVLAAALLGAAMILAAFSPTFFWAATGMAIVGFFSINFSSLGNVILQLESAPIMRGRVMALWTVAFLGTTPIGGPIIGWIGEHLGGRWGLGAGGVAALVAAAIGFFTLKEEKFEKIPEEVEMRSEEASVRVDLKE